MTRRLSLAAVLAVVMVITSALPVSGFDESANGSPPDDIAYRYDTTFSMSQAYKDRMANAAANWSTTWGSITYSSSGLSRFGFRFQDEVGTAPCPDSTCDLWLNANWAAWGKFYTGTGSSAGTVPNTYGNPYAGDTRGDAWGILVHELGHWRQLGHNVFGTCPGTLYAPAPSRAATSMCYSTSWPALEDGSGSAGIVPRRTISQDEIQGRHNEINNRLEADRELTECNGNLDEPEYYMLFWMATDTANRWCGNGLVSLNNNASVPYPELYQRVRGADVDGNNDGRFAMRARVMARENEIQPRAVLFVRHGTGNGLFSGEVTCDYGTLPLNTWVTINCGFTQYANNLGAIDLSNGSQWMEFEYGVRVTNKVDIDWIWIRDL